jgi:hypothetical protein
MSAAHSIARLLLGAVPVLVEYDHQEAEPQTRDHPGCPATVDILAVRIGAHEIDDPESVLSEWQLRRWEEQILEQIGDADEAARADADDRWLEQYRQRDADLFALAC